MPSPVPDSELVPGPTAARWDARSRVLRLAAILVVPLGAVLAVLGVPLTPLVIGVLSTLFLGAFTASLVLGQISLRTIRREMEAGYSTMFDFGGYELRDARTVGLLRAKDVEPVESGRVRGSILANMLRVHPDTILARRIRDDEKQNDEKHD